MVEGYNLFRLLSKLRGHISSRRRRQFSSLIFLMLIASVAEVLSIGSIIPFLAVLSSPGIVFEYAYLKSFYVWLGISTPSELLLPFAIFFCLAALLCGLVRLAVLWATTRLSFAMGADLSIDIYRKTLYQPYSAHISRNSSEIIAGISSKVGSVIYDILTPLLTACSSVIILVIIATALIVLNPLIAVSAILGFSIIYLLIIVLTKKYLIINSARVSFEASQVIKALQEGLGGIRDVLIDGTQNFYCQTYQRADLALRKAQGSNQFISGSPRYIVEALGTILMAGLAYMLVVRGGDGSAALPTLGALAFGAQRLLPMLQQIYSAMSNARGAQHNLSDAIALLDQAMPKVYKGKYKTGLKFNTGARFNGVSFRYDNHTPWILKDINLEIKKGSRIGCIGKTGSGKSTLLDIFMGLLTPTKGHFIVDNIVIGKENLHLWQSLIAHVPQVIYLADASIAENIAFGIPGDQIDFQRVREAAKQAQISQAIESWDEGYETKVGERGVRLSGGQRQRIGIARALYKEVEIIIFDEATSALDAETEESVMSAIGGLSKDLTIFMVAHRFSTLRCCDSIVELEDGSIKSIKTYEQIFRQGN